MTTTQQGFPQQSAALVNSAGIIQQSWYQLLIALWTRTGGAQGVSSWVSGDIKASGSATIQDGWLACDGSAISRSTYSGLFGAIGTTYGIGDGGSTFNLPNLGGKTLIGVGGGYVIGQTGGSAETTLSIADLPAHHHGVTDPGHTHAITDPHHTHTVTDPGHVHAVTDPQHTHAVTDPQHAHTLNDPGHVHASVVADSINTTGTAPGATQAGNTSSATTGVTVNPASTGVTNQNAATGLTVNSAVTSVTNASAATGVTNQTATTGITTQDTGSGDAFSTISPFVAINYMIKI